MSVRTSVLAAVVFFVTFTGLVKAQPREPLPTDTLAEVGTKVITATDLIERVELMPWPGKEQKSLHDTIKVQALQSMVAERLLALRAAEEGLGNDTISQLRVKTLEMLLLRDELYRREVREKVKVKPQEISRAMKRFARELNILLFAVRSRAAGEKLVRSLRASSRIDSLLARIDTSYVKGWDTVTVNLGYLDPQIEDVAYGLTDTSRVSSPVRLPNKGWFVLSLVGWKSNPAYVQRTLTERLSFVEREVRKRQETELSRKFLLEILTPQKAEADPAIFDLLASTVRGLMTANPSSYRRGNGYRLAETVDTLLFAFRPRLGEPFIRIETGPLLLGEVIEAFGTTEALIPTLEENDFRIYFNGAIKSIIEGELMSREALKRKLNMTDTYRHDMDVWTTHWLSELMMQQILRTVTVDEQDALDLLLERGSDLGQAYEVNIREILSDSLSASLHTLQRLDQGEDMATLAREESKRAAWATRGGESGFFRVSSSPQLGFLALAQDTGKLAGPFHISEGFSLFMVLGKRQNGRNGAPGFDTLMTTARRYAGSLKGQRALNHAIASLAETYGVKMYMKALSKVTLQPSNMVTKRFMGFGGVITAAPMLQHQGEWIHEVPEKTIVVP
jgi:peptidyl-prolyl cis-trans isomerase C